MKEIVIIGGGATGIVASILLKQRGFSVLLLEKSDRIGKKLLATGNGRCNLSNQNLSAEFYNNPNFVRPIIEKYNTQSVIDFFASINLLTRNLEGYIYPYCMQATAVLNVLLKQIEKLNIEVKTNCEVTKIEQINAKQQQQIKRQNTLGQNTLGQNPLEECANLLQNATLAKKINTENIFKITTNSGVYEAKNVIFCTGSNATQGANSHNLLQNLGHEITPLKAGLTWIKVDDRYIKGLNGIRQKAQASLIIDGKKIACETGEILFKEKGLSGIMIFNLASCYARTKTANNAQIQINLMPEFSANQIEAMLQKGDIEEVLQGIFAKPLCANLLDYAKNLLRNSLPNSGENCKLTAKSVANVIANFCVHILGFGDIKQAQVVCGGVSLEQVDNSDLQSKIVKNLYLGGEVLDIDGMCGGYNLQWAFSSAFAIANSIK
ncbi:MAG: aminoacetone oxidase family FAD-binding enzyme [Clostridia bacterium]